jgi:hypothetical protein
MSNWTADQDLATLRVTAASLRQRMGDAAASIAETEEWVADTLERLARARPHDAARLRSRAAHARDFAAQQRARATAYGAGCGDLRSG